MTMMTSIPYSSAPAPGHCAPANESLYRQTGSCLSADYLRLIARLYNSTYPNAKPIPLSSSKAVLLESLRTRFGNLEREWRNLQFLSEKAKNQVSSAFRPEKPRSWNTNEYEWLDCGNIRQVMSQYEKKYPSFKFLGVFPIDFDSIENGRCVVQAMCTFSVRQLKRQGYTRCAAVFNLDKHNESGSHWVAFYCGFSPTLKNNFGVYYYDSVAVKPPKEIVSLMERIRTQMSGIYGKKTMDKFESAHNTVRKQYKNTECGIFSMFFVTMCLDTKKSFAQICKSIGKDDEVHAYRNFFFCPSSSELARSKAAPPSSSLQV